MEEKMQVKGTVYVLVNNNPAPNISRLVCVSRDLQTHDELKMLELIYGRQWDEINRDKVISKGNFNNREHELVSLIQKDQTATPGPTTGYVLFSNELDHCGVALAALTATEIGVPFFIFQHKNGVLDKVEIFFAGQRYVATSSKLGAQIATGKAA